MTEILLTATPILIVVILVIAFLCSIYRVADVDKALVITGGKEPIIKVSGGSFVIPIFRKASFFDLCMLTVTADKDELKTKTTVPIVVDWTAQIRPFVNDTEILKKAIISFKERGQEGIINDVKLTLMGSVRSVVATLTPEQVQGDKDSFKTAIEDAVKSELIDMGLELVSLNIQDVSDKNGYFDNMAAIDNEAKRLAAEKVKAVTGQQIREQNTESNRIATQKELDTALQIAERQRDNDLKKAEFKAETDKANADAEIAGQLQTTIRLQEVAEQEGRVAVIRQEQLNLAAQKEQEVKKTNAETAKIEATIKAEEESNVATINAKAKAQVAEEEANGKAKAQIVEADGKAKAIEVEANATANATRVQGETEAEIIAKKGAAEAEAVKARLLAEAEGERALAEARASNDKVNFEIEKLKIEANARIEIATKTAQVMAEIGKNAEFVNIGGNNVSGNTGNVLLDTLAGVPGLMKTLNVENQALNGQSFNDELNGLVAAIADPIKGMLSTSESTNTTNNTTINEAAPVKTTKAIKDALTNKPSKKVDIPME